jgi:capsular exopolysaccharide synthesis family protein
MINFSELLWKPERISRRAVLSSVENSTDPGEDLSALRSIPVQQVRLEPAVRIVLKSDPQGAGADRFRLLRMRLRELKGLAKLRSLVITSPLPEDGKSTIALNLATALADEGRSRVLLVEADLHHPSLGKSLGIKTETGLAECIENGVEPLSVLRRIEPLGWYLLPAGNPRLNPTDLLQSEPLAKLLERINPYFDWVLIDTPPVRPLTDAVALSRQVDATLLVVRAGQTPKDAVQEAVDLIGRKHLLGIVFNGAETLNRLYSKYYGQYRKE